MNKSDTINELATSLCKLQGSLHDTTKDTKAYNYKYSTLSQILTYLRPQMEANGLSVTQLVTGQESAVIGVETILMHSSGQWIGTVAHMGVQGSNLAQEAGKVITYLRRYSLAGIVGLTQADNDAAIESKPRAGSVKVNDIKAKFEACKTMADLHVVWGELEPDSMKYFEELKNTIKAKLRGKNDE